MKSQRVAGDAGARTYVLVLDSGDEAFATITAFAEDNGLSGASITAIGAFSSAKLGWFDFDSKRYEPIAVDEQCEALSLIGDVASGDDGKASLHLHAVVGLSDGSTRGGHLMQAVAHPTLEVTITETAAHLRRTRRPELGIALIDLAASGGS